MYVQKTWEIGLDAIIDYESKLYRRTVKKVAREKTFFTKRCAQFQNNNIGLIMSFLSGKSNYNIYLIQNIKTIV